MAEEPTRPGASEPWWPGPLLGFDTETTGVDVENDRIVTMALVHRDRDGTRVRTWLVDPGVDIPAAATAIHGVSTAQAREHGTAPRTALDQAAEGLATALRDGVPVVVLNARFDLRLLDAELRRHRLATLPQRLGGPVRPVLDPLVLDRAQDRYRKGKRTLADLCTVYGVAQTGALHSADVDAVATLDVLEQILTRFGDLTTTDLSTLHDQQVTWHQTWAESFNAYQQRSGRPTCTDTDWP
ncbi:MAG: exonuclease domain-containing protein [Micrococcales bacterium]|nr:exonuclease domain-containing protein [Micrococcales bacterium]